MRFVNSKELMLGCKSYQPAWYFVRITYDEIDMLNNVNQRYVDETFIRAKDLIKHIQDAMWPSYVVVVSLQVYPTLTNSKKLHKYKVWPKGQPGLSWEIEAPSEEDIRHFIHIPGISDAARQQLAVKKVPKPKPLW